MDLEEITLFEKLSQLEAYQGISNSTYIIPSSSVLSPLLNNEIHLFVRISIPQCYACSPLRLFLSIQKSAIAKVDAGATILAKSHGTLYILNLVDETFTPLPSKIMLVFGRSTCSKKLCIVHNNAKCLRNIPGVAPKIFRRGAESSNEGAKIWFSGYYKCQKSLSPSDGR